MADLTIEQVRLAKRNLEGELRQYIALHMKAFTEKTGQRVTGIEVDIRTAYNIGARDLSVLGPVNVKLEDI